MPDCVFCGIARGERATNAILETEDTMFFYDIAPKAKVHVVGITKKHLSSLDEMTEEDRGVVGKLMDEVGEVIRKTDIDPAKGYRVVTNIGPQGGQEIPHLHFHILGGEPVGPLRC